MLRILAAFIFFTRLPFWRLAEVPAACFKNIVSHWARARAGVRWLVSVWFVGIGIVRYLLDSSAIRGDLMRHDYPIADNRLPA